VGYASLVSSSGEPSNASTAADERLRRIESVTDAALAQLDVEALLAELLDRVRELLAVDTATVLLLDPSAQELVVTVALGIETSVRQGIRVPMGKGFAGRVAAEKQPVIIEQVDQTNVMYSVLAEHGICSLLGVPLLSNGIVIGVLHVGTLVPHRFSNDDIRLLQIAAERIVLATQFRRAEVERAAAAVFQRSLCQHGCPQCRGWSWPATTFPRAMVRSAVTGMTYSRFLPAGCAS
jgi:phosphoserine phosphatase RsbU/P